MKSTVSCTDVTAEGRNRRLVALLLE